MKFIKSLTGAVAIATTFPLQAETAVFRDEVLTVPQVLVQRPHGPALLGNVAMARRQDGSFAMTGYDVLPIVDVQSISVEKDQYPPGTVVVVVQGFKSTPCADVAEAAVTRAGDTFHFALEELPPPDHVRCIAQVAPMMEAFGIQTGDLAPGDYAIVYGEMRVEFTLHPAQ